jgi:hypothetical protein
VKFLSKLLCHATQEVITKCRQPCWVRPLPQILPINPCLLSQHMSPPAFMLAVLPAGTAAAAAKPHTGRHTYPCVSSWQQQQQQQMVLLLRGVTTVAQATAALAAGHNIAAESAMIHCIVVYMASSNGSSSGDNLNAVTVTVTLALPAMWQHT